MSHSKSRPHPAWRHLVALTCALLLGRTALNVEDGQFEREYSRLYTMLVLGIAGLLLLALGTVLVGTLRERARRA